MTGDRREQAAGTATTGDGEELQRRYDAARKLEPGEPGGGAEWYLDELEALHVDAEAYAEPELLFKIRLEYSYAVMHVKRYENSSREVTGDVLKLLRKSLVMWHEAPNRYDDAMALWSQFNNLLAWYIDFDGEPADRVRRLLDELDRYCPPASAEGRYVLDDARRDIEARCGNVEEVERLSSELRERGIRAEVLEPDVLHRNEAIMWTRLGRHDRAIKAMAPVLTGQVPVRGHPDEENLLMPYLHTGRVEEAVAAHQRTYARSGMKLAQVAAHLEFCARTGNEERGLDVLQRNIDKIGYRCRHVIEAWPAAAAALLCLRAAAKGLGREFVWHCECADPDCTDLPIWSCADLGAQLRWGATRLARQVDGLNGTSYFGERIDALLHAEPLVERLELPPDVEPPAHLAVPPPSGHLDATDATDTAGLRAELERARGTEHWRARIARIQRVMQDAMATGAVDVLAEARLRLLEDLLETGWGGWQTNRFSALRELFRTHDERPSLLDAGQLDAMWRAVPLVLDESLTRPGPHLRQIRDLLDAVERHCRPESDDLHHVRWFRTEAAARSGDADATRAALASFRELPPIDRYSNRESVLRVVGWWLDLGRDREAIEEMAPLPGDDREDLLLPAYLRAGRPGKAREVHERTYRTAPGFPEATAHLHYCAETGLLDHAREIVHRVVDLFHGSDTDDDFTLAELRLYAAGARICGLLVEAGHDEDWTWPADACCPDEHDWTYARLGDVLRRSLDEKSARWEEVFGSSFRTYAITGTGGGVRSSQ